MKVKVFGNKTLLFVTALILTSCTKPNIKQDYSLNRDSGNGVLLASLTRSGVGSGFGGFSLVAKLRGIGNDYDEIISVSGDEWPCPMTGVIPHRKPCGRLVVIELPKGQFEYYSWAGSKRVGNKTEKIKPTKEFSKKFTIEPGKVVYLGNIHFAIGGAKYRMDIYDESERDISLFLKKFPKISKEEVKKELLDKSAK